MSEIDWSKAPEAATHFWHGNECFYAELNGKFYLADRMNQGSVHSPASWIAELIQRPSPAWSGEGLPPVGVVCEVSKLDGCNTWIKAEILFITKSCVVFKADMEEKALYTYELKFRPIRTPEQIAADEREAAIQAMAKVLGMVACDDYVAAAAMYDAGYRKVEVK